MATRKTTNYSGNYVISNELCLYPFTSHSTMLNVLPHIENDSSRWWVHERCLKFRIMLKMMNETNFFLSLALRLLSRFSANSQKFHKSIFSPEKSSSEARKLFHKCVHSDDAPPVCRFIALVIYGVWQKKSFSISFWIFGWSALVFFFLSLFMSFAHVSHFDVVISIRKVA